MSATIETINRSNETAFIESLRGIFEHSPWVPSRIFSQRPFASLDSLHRAMCDQVRAATNAERLQLLRNHPQLAGKEADAGTLTDESQREQAGAGLNQCNAAELATIKSLNQAYAEKFEFPFIIAVTGLDKYQIIAAMQRRLTHAPDEELATALAEVEKIARIRLDALIDS